MRLNTNGICNEQAASMCYVCFTLAWNKNFIRFSFHEIYVLFRSLLLPIAEWNLYEDLQREKEEKKKKEKKKNIKT